MPAHQFFIRYPDVIFSSTLLEFENSIKVGFRYSYRHYEYKVQRYRSSKVKKSGGGYRGKGSASEAGYPVRCFCFMCLIQRRTSDQMRLKA